VMRGFSPTGVARQFLAVLTTPGRGEALRGLRLPTLVIHGESDPLVPLAAGRATADAIADAQLLTIPGMGHDLPRPLFEPLATAIADHAAKAERAGAA
jgi:pimeloyl-ACP methyl ester carboxylesterase